MSKEFDDNLFSNIEEENKTLSKSEKTKLAKQENAKRRESMTLKVFAVKLSLNTTQERFLNHQMIQCKNFANYCLYDIFNADRKSTVIPSPEGYFPEWGVGKKNKNIVIINKHSGCHGWTGVNLPYSTKSAIKNKLKSMVKSLSSNKKNGTRVGRIKRFKTFNYYPLESYPASFRFTEDKKRFLIPNCKHRFRMIGGLDQFPEDAEFTNAEIIKKNNGFFIHISFYTHKKEISSNGICSIDWGIKDSITLYDGIDIKKYKISINERKKLKLLQKRLSRKKINSCNYQKNLLKIRRMWDRIKAIKTDAVNKIVHEIEQNYHTVIVQKDSFKGWQEGFFGKQISDGALYRLKTSLKRKIKNYIEVDQHYPSTKTCFKCKNINKNITLKDRVFECNCGNIIDRDSNAAMNIHSEGLRILQSAKTVDNRSGGKRSQKRKINS